MPFEITVQEKHVDEDVLGATLDADLAAATKAANARHAYEQVINDEDVTGWSDQEKTVAAAAAKAAVDLAGVLGGDDDHFRVTIHGDEHYLNVQVHRTATADA